MATHVSFVRCLCTSNSGGQVALLDLLLLLLARQWNLFLHLFDDVLDLRLGEIHVLVDLNLVGFVHFRQSEDSNNAEDDERHAVKPGADVGQDPEQQPELEGVDDILDQEQTTELAQSARHVLHDDVSEVMNFLFRQRDVHIKVLLEGVSLSALLDGAQDVLVDPEGEGDGEGGQGEVGDHAEH